MTLSDPEVQSVVDGYADSTDAPGSIVVVARWFRDALEQTRGTGGCAALEIGVRGGGTSAIMCAIAEAVAEPSFLVLGADPYGLMPYYSPGPAPPVHGDEFYTAAKSLLGPFRRSVLFRMTAMDFISVVLPNYSWWVEGKQYPASRRFLSFVFLDGQHENVNVVQEAAGVVPFMAPGGVLAIDNTELVPEAVALLKASPRLGLREHLHWASADSPLQRDRFTVG